MLERQQQNLLRLARAQGAEPEHRCRRRAVAPGDRASVSPRTAAAGEALAHDAVRHASVRVARKADEALDIRTFELVDVAGAALPAFSAGSHVDVHLPNGLTRQYSLCNDPTETHRYLLGVLRDPASRGGSQAMHDAGARRRRAADQRAEEPLSALAHDARRSLLLAGGIGITPILCMAERLALTAARRSRCTTAPASANAPPFSSASAARPMRPRCNSISTTARAEQKLDIPALLAKPEAGRPPVRLRPQGVHGRGAGPGQRQRLAEAPAALRVLCRRRGQGAATAIGRFRSSWPVRAAWSTCRRADGGAGPGRCRRGGADLLRAGRLRHLPDPCARRRA